MQARNSKVKASTIEHAGTDRELEPSEERERRVAKRIARAGHLTRTPDKIAGDQFSLRNYPVPKGKELFPIEWKMQFVDLFYPYAKDEAGEPSPVFLDMPVTLHDIAMCERKLPVLKEKGLRYTYVTPTEGEFEGLCRLQGLDPVKLKADQESLRAKTPTNADANA